MNELLTVLLVVLIIGCIFKAVQIGINIFGLIIKAIAMKLDEEN